MGRHLMGTTNKQCVKAEPQCIHRGQICGCAGCLTQQCCGGAHCLDVGGQGGKKYCVNAGAAIFAEENSTELAEGQAVNVLENSTDPRSSCLEVERLAAVSCYQASLIFVF